MKQTESLEQRIQALEDIEAIKQLKARYFRACDAKDTVTMRECFHDGEVELDYGRVGIFNHRDDLMAVFEQLAVNAHIVEMHHGQNPEVSLVDSENAEAMFGLYYLLLNPRDQTITQLGANYSDRFLKVEGQWKIVASRCDVSSTLLLDTSDKVLKVLFAGRQAPVELDDPNKQA